VIVLYRSGEPGVPGLVTDSLPVDAELMSTLSRALDDIFSWIPGRCVQARLIKIGPGGRMESHVDVNFMPEANLARLHLVITTNPEVYFIINGQRLSFREGELWYLNNGLPHEVHNPGSTDRIHLVVDVVKDSAFYTLLRNCRP
jgi:aspartyl/asparaginyl beta-hydroxylase (cupin superfamily)